jgi:DnaJ-like protein
MFDRGKNDRADGPAYAEITLKDGRELKGRFNIPQGRSLPDVLNSGSSFMEFEPFGGECILIAKAALQAIRPTNLPGVPTLGAGLREDAGFDPYAILRIGRDAGADEVRKAYLDLAKTYHPDRYATVDLPSEVRAYLAAMARRINAAHDAVEDALKQRAARQEPVFTKAGQA